MGASGVKAQAPASFLLQHHPTSTGLQLTGCHPRPLTVASLMSLGAAGEPQFPHQHRQERQSALGGCVGSSGSEGSALLSRRPECSAQPRERASAWEGLLPSTAATERMLTFWRCAPVFVLSRSLP